MKIDSYSFGKMKIDGHEYSSDLYITPAGCIFDSWWRETGHFLQTKDIADLIESQPEVIIVGTGESGVMQVDPQLEKDLSQMGIELKNARTGKAVETFNNLVDIKKVGACFHLTC